MYIKKLVDNQSSTRQNLQGCLLDVRIFGVLLHGGHVVGSSLVLARQLLKSEALGLRNAQRGEDTQEHEESVDLEHVVEPRTGVRLGGASCPQRGNGSLGDDGADLS